MDELMRHLFQTDNLFTIPISGVVKTNCLIGGLSITLALFAILYAVHNQYISNIDPILPTPLKIDDYNVIIDIKSILAIREGWEIKTDGSPFASMFVNQNSEYSKLLVALTGDYNSGLKRLASSSINSNRGTHSIKDIKAIDNLISQSYKIANFIIEVRDTGNNDDICSSQQRHAEYLQDGRTNENKIPVMVVVVHNFKNLKTVAQVEKYISDDITNPEIGGVLTVSSKAETKGCKFWHVDTVLHYVLAQEGSEAGNVYNKCTFDLIRLKVLQDQGGIPKINVLNKLIQVMEQSIRNYIKDPNVSKDSFIRVKKDETIMSYASVFKSLFGSSKPDLDEPTLIETHPFKLTIDNNTIKLVNSSFDLQFSYKDCCGFKNIDYTPQLIHQIQSSELRRNINPRTYGEIKKEFRIPSKPWIDCARLQSTAKYIDGVALVLLTKDSTVIGGSPFPKEDKK
ncbi:hypothetical protein ACTFIZ_009985 [Dictyostelium cf. discoideum]